MSMFFLQDDPDRPHLDVLLAEALRIGSTEREGWRLKRDGSRLWVNSVITTLPDESGAVRGFVVVSRDLTERKRQEDEMKKQATVDPLTGAYNRRKGDAFLAVEFSRWKRDGQPFAVLMLDIDDFKAINDRFGHAAGYAVLCALVEACQKTLRPVDIVSTALNSRRVGEGKHCVSRGAGAKLGQHRCPTQDSRRRARRLTGPPLCFFRGQPWI